MRSSVSSSWQTQYSPSQPLRARHLRLREHVLHRLLLRHLLGVGDGIVIFQTEQRVQFALLQFLHAFRDVVLEYEIEKRLLFGVEVGVDTIFLN
jgi:hypothetical protein